MSTQYATLEPVEAVLAGVAKQCLDALRVYGPDHMPAHMHGVPLMHYTDSLALALADVPPGLDGFRVIPIAEFMRTPDPLGAHGWSEATAYANANGLTTKAVALAEAIGQVAMVIDLAPDYMHGRPRKHYAKLCTKTQALASTAQIEGLA